MAEIQGRSALQIVFRSKSLQAWLLSQSARTASSPDFTNVQDISLSLKKKDIQDHTQMFFSELLITDCM